MEIWKPIKGYKHYLVSNRGRIKSLDRKVASGIKNNNQTIKYGRTLKPALKKNGYLTIMLYQEPGKRKTLTIHRLVCQTFIENPDNKPMVNHINGNKTDNRVKNLEWCTLSENMQHAIKNNLKGPPPHRKQIMCVETGQRYPSSTQAAEWLNRTKYKFAKDVASMARKIRSAALNSKLTAYGYHWKDIGAESSTTSS
jgi:hypothetical protein